MGRSSSGTNGKKALARLSPSRLYAFVKVARLMVLSIALTVAGLKLFPILVIVALATSFAAWYRYMQTIFTEYILTEETLSVRTGIVARQLNSLELYRVKDYTVSQSVSERILGLMTVTLMTSDRTHPRMDLEGIPKSDLMETVRELVQKARMRNRIIEM